jgi:xylulokinase
VWLPHLNGSDSPESDRYSRAAVVGMQMDQTSGDLFRGFLESMAFYMRYNLNTIQNLSKQKVEQVILVGGTTRLTLLSQLKADVLNLPVITPNLPEAVATGAALLAGLGIGAFQSPSEAVESLRYGATVFEPDPVRHNWYMPIYEQVYKPLYMTVRGLNHHLAAIA